MRAVSQSVSQSVSQLGSGLDIYLSLTHGRTNRQAGITSPAQRVIHPTQLNSTQLAEKKKTQTKNTVLPQGIPSIHSCVGRILLPSPSLTPNPSPSTVTIPPRRSQSNPPCIKKAGWGGVPKNVIRIENAKPGPNHDENQSGPD